MKSTSGKSITIIFLSLVVLSAVYLLLRPTDQPEEEIVKTGQEIEEETDLLHPSGLIDADGVTTVVNNCTQCHSTAIITQNRLDEEQWHQLIIWMQETQNLWNLGENEQIIIDYLVTNYPQVKKGRRANLSEIEWYELKK